MNIFHKLFQDKFITFFEVTDNFNKEFSSHIYSITNQSGAKANKLLVGEIINEYYIDSTIINQFYLNTFFDIIKIHIQKQVELLMNSDLHDFNIKILSAWLNVMNKHEFNPIHTHEKNDLNFVYWMNDFDSSKEISVSRDIKTPMFDVKTQKMIGDRTVKGSHTLIRNNEYVSITPQKNFGIIYDHDLIHQVYPFDVHEKRESFVMNLKIT